jgi:hypothetical protein
VQKEYDRAKAQTGDRNTSARHILVATEDDAKSVIADVKKGGKFEEIASKRSLDEAPAQGRRPRLERAGQLRQGLLRRDGEARTRAR